MGCYRFVADCEKLVGPFKMAVLSKFCEQVVLHWMLDPCKIVLRRLSFSWVTTRDATQLRVANIATDYTFNEIDGTKRQTPANRHGDDDELDWSAAARGCRAPPTKRPRREKNRSRHGAQHNFPNSPGPNTPIKKLPGKSAWPQPGITRGELRYQPFKEAE